MKDILYQLFSSKVRVALLSLFLSHPTEKFYLRELGRRLGKPPSSLQRELERLAQAGLLASAKEANLRYYRLNQDSPVYPDLKALFLKTVGVGGFLREHLSSLGEIKVAFIYGSYGSVARGTEDVASDIDLLVIGRVDLEELDRVIGGAEAVLKREINYVAYSAEEWQKKRGSSFGRQIRAQPKIYLIGSQDVV